MAIRVVSLVFADVQNLKQYAQNFVVAKEMPDQVAVMRPAYNENTYSDTYSYVSNIWRKLIYVYKYCWQIYKGVHIWYGTVYNSLVLPYFNCEFQWILHM